MSNDSSTFLKNPWSTRQSFMAGPTQLNIQKFLPDTTTSLFLYNVNTNESVTINLIPDKLSEEYAPRIVSQTPYGILHPINFYVGGEAKRLQFSFNMHEDMFNIDGSIYKLVDKIKRMSEPITKYGRVLPPIVYFQLGKQFAGKGHITTSFNFEKPFSNNRYKWATCNVEFVFHEVFQSDNINVLADDNIVTLSDYSIDLSDTPYSGMSIEDFYTQNLDYDYIIRGYLYDENKLSAVFQLIAQEASLTTGSTLSVDDIREMVLSAIGISHEADEASPISDINSQLFADFDNPYFTALLQLYLDFFNFANIAQFLTDEARLSNLNAMKDSAYKLRAEFLQSYKKDPTSIYNGVDTTSIGWYENRVGNTYEWVQMPSDQQELFKKLLGLTSNVQIINGLVVTTPEVSGGFLQLIQTQIQVYELLKTPGE